jgi:hypothetical protein
VGLEVYRIVTVVRKTEDSFALNYRLFGENNELHFSREALEDYKDFNGFN